MCCSYVTTIYPSTDVYVQQDTQSSNCLTLVSWMWEWITCSYVNNLFSHQISVNWNIFERSFPSWMSSRQFCNNCEMLSSYHKPSFLRNEHLFENQGTRSTHPLCAPPCHKITTDEILFSSAAFVVLISDTGADMPFTASQITKTEATNSPCLDYHALEFVNAWYVLLVLLFLE